MSKGLTQRIFPFLEWFPEVKNSWKSDMLAGLTGMVIVMPQAIAFAIIAGLPIVYGFYTAIISPIIASLFGSSWKSVSGPTVAMSIVTYATVSKFFNHETELESYVALTLTLTLIMGMIQFLMGVIKMGKLVNFISHSVIVGFTAGAAVLISIKQLRHILDVTVPNNLNIVETIQYLGTHLSSANTLTLIVGISSLAIGILMNKFIPKVALLAAIILGSLLAFFMGGSEAGITTLQGVKATFPSFAIPKLEGANYADLFSSALVLAILGSIQSVAIGKSMALKSQEKLNSSQEFIGQGLSNLVGSMFSCYASSASFTRSAVNQQAGGKTPMAAIFSALFLFLALLLIAPLTEHLPKATMGGVILLVAYKLIDFEHIKRIWKSSKREFFVFGVTLLGTIFIRELEYALLAGVIASFIFYVEKTSRPNVATMGLNDKKNFINVIRQSDLSECPQMKIIRIDGAIYFGALENIQKAFQEIEDHTDIKHIMLAAQGVNFVDLAGAEWMVHEAKKWKDKGGGIYFAGLKIVAQNVLQDGGFKDQIGHDYFFPNRTEAMIALNKILDPSKCNQCKHRNIV